MSDKPAVLTINRSFKRPSPVLYEPFTGVPIGNIVDAQGRIGALDYRIKPVCSVCSFLGPAMTVDAGPRDNLAAWMALEHVQPGDVLMIATGGYDASSVVGDIFAGMAKNAGVVAIVTDGVVRDREGLEKVGIPVFARGISSNSPQKNGPGTVGLPIVVGGVAVASGDVVAGDQDGVVVVGQRRLSVVTESLASVLKKETAMEAQVESGNTAPDWLAAIKKGVPIAYID